MKCKNDCMFPDVQLVATSTKEYEYECTGCDTKWTEPLELAETPKEMIKPAPNDYHKWPDGEGWI